jgi:capsule polysaccharide export protein KpsE/RkpR
MNAPVTIIGRLTHVRLFGTAWARAAIFGGLIAILLALTFFPERHRAATSLTPTDPESLGLSGTLGQLGAINNVFGNQAAVEVAMRVAKSVYARDTVIDQLKLEQRLAPKTRLEIHRWLEEKVDIRSLRGGIITIELLDRNEDLARDIVGAYATATQNRLAQISRKQTQYKRDVLLKLVSDASTRLAVAQSAYDDFRLRNRYADPRASMEAIGEQIPALEGAIKSKQVQLAAARRMFTDDNVQVIQIRAELSALQQQLAMAKATNPNREDSVGMLVTASSQLFKLERDLGIAKALYDSYMRYLQGTAVEDLTSTANVRVLEAPYVDTSRQMFLPALAAAIALFLLWVSIEFYRLRPPVGDHLAIRRFHG